MAQKLCVPGQNIVTTWKSNLNAIKLYQPYIAKYKNHDVIGIDLYGIPLTTIQIFGLLDV